MKNEDIEIRVYIRPNMFRVNENMFNLIGLGELEKFFTIPDYKGNGDTIGWFYPERFLNIVEQKELITRLEKSNYKGVRIITQSPFIMQCCKNVKVVNIEGDEMPSTDFKLSCDDVGLPDDGGLNVL